MTTLSLTSSPNTIFDRFAKLNWGIITILIALAFIGVLMHFSVSSAAWTDMPLKHGIRFGVLLVSGLTWPTRMSRLRRTEEMCPVICSSTDSP